MSFLSSKFGFESELPRLIDEDLIELVVRLLRWIYYQFLSQGLLQW